MHKEAFLSLGILNLGLAYALFSSQEYFSLLATVLLLLLVLLSLASIVFAFADAKKKSTAIFTLLAALSAISFFYVVLFNHYMFQFFTASIVLAIISSFASIAVIYFGGKIIIGYKGAERLLLILLFSFFISLVVTSFYLLANMSNLVDEPAFNYYSAYLFVHGKNPYNESMQPIINARGIMPSLHLNGFFGYAYSYPALSFILYLPIVYLGITSLMSFFWVVAFASIIASFLLYIYSGYKSSALLPIGIWLLFVLQIPGIPNPYVASSLFLLVAYIIRKRTILSGTFLGLAASTTQLAWLALPFFYIIYFWEHGKKPFAKALAVSLLVFFIINIYFALISPGPFLSNVLLATFSASRRGFTGTSLAQLFLPFYNVPIAYPSLMMVITYLFSIAVFYFYSKSMRFLMAITPIFLFFLDWINFPRYGLPFVPLLILIFYESAHAKTAGDKLESKKPVVYALAALAFTFFLSTIYAHSLYMHEPGLKIVSTVPIISVQNGYYYISGLNITVYSNQSMESNVTILIFSRNPNGGVFGAGSLLPPIKPNSIQTYNANFQLPINNDTKFVIIAANQYYITLKRGGINI